MARIRAGALTVVLFLAAAGAGCEIEKGPPEGTPDRSAPVSVEAEILDRFGEKEQHQLALHLAGSARWRLSSSAGGLKADRRDAASDPPFREGELRVGTDGFVFRHQPWRRHRTRLILAPQDARIQPPPGAVRVRTGHGPVELPLDPANHPDLASTLMIEGAGGLVLEVSEESPDAMRDTTVRLIAEVCDELKTVLPRLESIVRAGILSPPAPPESRHPGPPALRVRALLDAGAYDARGYLRVPGPGRLFLRVRDPQSSELLAEETVEEQSSEWLHPEGAGRCTFFQSELRLGEEATPRRARVEAWFQPGAPGVQAGGRAPVRLLESLYDPGATSGSTPVTESSPPTPVRPKRTSRRSTSPG